jgi:hypothetical protein
MALADYRGFNDNGFRIAALIDVDRKSRTHVTPAFRWLPLRLTARTTQR